MVGKQVVLDTGQLERLMNYARSVSGDYQFLIETKGNRIIIRKYE